MKNLLLLLALAPSLALAHGAPGASPDPGAERRGPDPEAAQRLQRRMKLALTLGLAEALELTDAQALQVGAQLERLAPRRQAAHQALREAVQVLRRSARGEPVAAAEVDRALARLLDARDQLQALDRELIGAVTRDQAPQKRARAVLFLAKFQQRALQGFGGGERRGGRDPQGPGAGPGRAGRGEGPLGMAEDGALELDAEVP